MDSALVRLMTARRFAPLVRHTVPGRVQRQPAEERAGDPGDVSAGRSRRPRCRRRSSMVAGALFIAPFFLFSGASGTLGRPVRQGAHRSVGQDRRDRHHGDRSAGIVARQRADAPADALLSRHALDRLWSDQVRTAPAAPPRRRARRRQRAGRGRNVPRDSRSARFSAAASLLARQRRAHRRRVRRAVAAIGGWLDRATIPLGAAVVRRGPAARPRWCAIRSTSSATWRSVDNLLLPILAISWFWLFGRPRRVRPAGLREGRALRQRAGGDADAGAVRDGRRRRFVLAERLLHGEVSARFVPGSALAMAVLCDRPVPGERGRARGGASPTCRVPRRGPEAGASSSISSALAVAGGLFTVPLYALLQHESEPATGRASSPPTTSSTPSP